MEMTGDAVQEKQYRWSFLSFSAWAKKINFAEKTRKLFDKI